MDHDESDQPDWLQRYPPADISPSEFEEWVAEMLASVGPDVDDLRVEVHDRMTGIDGSYDFDATARYRWGGLDFLVIVEAKRHANPIKRELVQALHSKVQSVGAHKGVLISTARFQSGALEFAKVHGIALVSVTEGRFTFETRAPGPAPALSRERAFVQFGLPTFVGFCYGPGDTPESTTVTLISTGYPEYIRDILLAAPRRERSE